MVLLALESKFGFHNGKMKRTIFITGTDTGVGKTVLTVLMVKFLRARGVNAAALKPVCSGGRGDARKLAAAMNGALELDEINPWHFRAPIAPLLSARRERKHLHPPEVLAHVRAMQKKFDVLLIEGAGGLLSPLGENFDSGDLIAALGAAPLIVAPNRLGAVNHILLTLEALPRSAAARARVVLMAPPKRDAATVANAKLLAGYFDAGRMFKLPWLGENISAGEALKNPQVRQMLRNLLRV